jgi:S-adenosylmethionine decarboxylase
MPDTNEPRSDTAALAPIGSGKNDYFSIRNGVRFAGLHLIIDLYGAERLDDIAFVEETLRRCIQAANATLIHMHLHHFEPNGVSGVAVLAESHISVHTWPESHYAAFDVFMCGNTQPEVCVEIMRQAFKPSRVSVSEHLRGQGL